jgi:hypothetical protein
VIGSPNGGPSSEGRKHPTDRPAEAPQLVPLGPGDAYSSQGEQCWGCHSWLSGKPPEGASGGWLCRWVSSMVIGSKARRRSISMLVPLPADVVGTAVHRYLAAGLAPMGLVADASRLVTGSFYGMARAMRATRDMSVRPMVSAALMPSRGRSEERPSPA